MYKMTNPKHDSDIAFWNLKFIIIKKILEDIELLYPLFIDVKVEKLPLIKYINNFSDFNKENFKNGQDLTEFTEQQFKKFPLKKVKENEKYKEIKDTYKLSKDLIEAREKCKSLNRNP